MCQPGRSLLIGPFDPVTPSITLSYPEDKVQIYQIHRALCNAAIKDLSILLSSHSHTTSHQSYSTAFTHLKKTQTASLTSAHTVPSVKNTLPCFSQLRPPNLSVLFRCPLLHTASTAFPDGAPTVRGRVFLYQPPLHPVPALTWVSPSGLSPSGDGVICPRRALHRQGWDCPCHPVLSALPSTRPATEGCSARNEGQTPSRPPPSLARSPVWVSHTAAQLHTSPVGPRPRPGLGLDRLGPRAPSGMAERLSGCSRKTPFWDARTPSASPAAHTHRLGQGLGSRSKPTRDPRE